MFDNSDKSAQTSLTKNWGGEEDQSTWLKWKKSVIAQTIDLIKGQSDSHQESDSFNNLYKYIAKSRFQIAQELHQSYNIGKIRSRGDFATTPLNKSGRYADFYDYLLFCYNNLPQQTVDLEDKSYYIPMLKSAFRAFQLEEITDVKNYEGKYSTIELCTGKTAEFEEIKPFLISHPVFNESEDFKIFEDFEKKLRSPDLTSREKEKIIKEMFWHLANLMPCQRGSAAIAEILIASLCEAHNIPYKEWNYVVPMDLVAIFSATSEQFSNNFSLDPQNEILQELNAFLEGDNDKTEKEVANKLKQFILGNSASLNEMEKEVLNSPDSKLVNLLTTWKLQRGILIENILHEIGYNKKLPNHYDNLHQLPKDDDEKVDKSENLENPKVEHVETKSSSNVTKRTIKNNYVVDDQNKVSNTEENNSSEQNNAL